MQILQGEWNDVTDEEKEKLQKLVYAVSQNITDSVALGRCKYMLSIFMDPWRDLCLAKILTADPKLTLDEGKYLFCTLSTYLFKSHLTVFQSRIT